MVSSRIISFVGDKLVSEVSPNDIPKIGAKSFYGKKQCGRVVDLIGNVKKPYLVLKVNKKILPPVGVEGKVLRVED